MKALPLIIKSGVTVAVLFFSGSASFLAQASTVHTIVIEGMKFVPESLEVSSGDTVIWINKDFFPHTVTSVKKDVKDGLDSGEIKANASWKFMANRTGTFPYICTLHPVMNGSLTVK